MIVAAVLVTSEDSRANALNARQEAACVADGGKIGDRNGFGFAPYFNDAYTNKYGGHCILHFSQIQKQEKLQNK